MSERRDPRELCALIDRYCECWSEPDAGRRAALLSTVWASDATYTDPTIHACNADELLAHIANVVARRPGAKVVRTSAIDNHHRIARFAWHVVHADGTTLPDGLDIARISADGEKIECIVGFFGLLHAERQV